MNGWTHHLAIFAGSLLALLGLFAAIDCAGQKRARLRIIIWLAVIAALLLLAALTWEGFSGNR